MPTSWPEELKGDVCIRIVESVSNRLAFAMWEVSTPDEDQDYRLGLATAFVYKLFLAANGAQIPARHASVLPSPATQRPCFDTLEGGRSMVGDSV